MSCWKMCIVSSDFVDVVVFGVSLFLPCLTLTTIKWFIHPHWYVCLSFQSEHSVWCTWLEADRSQWSLLQWTSLELMKGEGGFGNESPCSALPSSNHLKGEMETVCSGRSGPITAQASIAAHPGRLGPACCFNEDSIPESPVSQSSEPSIPPMLHMSHLLGH